MLVGLLRNICYVDTQMTYSNLHMNVYMYNCSTVRKNFRICVIIGARGTKFQRRCRQYPNLFKNVNIMCFPHWTKQQLIRHASYHIKSKS